MFWDARDAGKKNEPKPAKRPATTSVARTTPIYFPLVGGHVKLRPLGEADFPAVARLCGDRSAMRWVGDGMPLSPAQARRVFDRQLDNQRTRGFSVWAVIERSSGSLVGLAGLDVVNSRVALSCRLPGRYASNGYSVEAAALCVEAVFSDLRLAELAAFIKPGDHGTAGMLRSFGFRQLETVSVNGSQYVHHQLEARYRPFNLKELAGRV
jgi:[ribosomal protein S5]-alanine N-acetyltransferase